MALPRPKEKSNPNKENIDPKIHKNKIPPEGQGYNNKIQFETEFDKQVDDIRGEEGNTQHTKGDDMWDVWIVRHDEMHAHESRVENAMMVVIDSAATVGVIGRHEKERFRNRRTAPRVRVRTAIGIVDKDEVGDLDTSHGVLTGYIISEGQS